MTRRKIIACPFCNNSEEGCCYCDHTGKIYEDVLPEPKDPTADYSYHPEAPTPLDKDWCEGHKELPPFLGG